jgi:hypothetical protein
VALWWLVSKINGKRTVYIQEAGSLIHARLVASMAGFDGEFVEAHQLDAKSAKKVPKGSVGRSLSLKEAGELLKRLG